MSIVDIRRLKAETGRTLLGFVFSLGGAKDLIYQRFVNEAIDRFAPPLTETQASLTPSRRLFPTTGFAVYVHYPFCSSACKFCPFAKTVNDSLIEEYCSALLSEIGRVRDMGLAEDAPVTSVYFGGGTPTLMPHHWLKRIVEMLRDSFDISPTVPMTLEGNPESMAPSSLPFYRELGFNRFSVGVQSFGDTVLRQMGRSYTGKDACSCVSKLIEAGADNVSIDLMYGFDEQSEPMVEEDLSIATSLGVSHVSLFPLVESVAQRGLRAEGRRTARQGRMFRLARQILEDGGFDQYSTEDFARSQKRCNYQADCWRVPSKDMIAFGSSSFGSYGNQFYVKEPSTRAFIAAAQTGAFPLAAGSVSEEELLKRKFLLGLHFLSVDRKAFARIYGRDPMDSSREIINLLKALRLLSIDEDTIRLTSEGAFLYAKVWSQAMLARYDRNAGRNTTTSKS